ncbi:thioredoxin-like protein [Elsinoe ampelina]|uniref:Thioredoxin-like protein n=1 Tax=Elsinoe ampelina TaxID=302913 RepID=A0A6A6GCV1_9PEZI|nr:thioredoxin-like protein [Elsinoe ampelina]
MSHTSIPASIPTPHDDGATSHLPGALLPSLPLPTTASTTLDPSTLIPLTIIFIYPRTGAPGETIPDSWNAIPGARGCTPQACSFRDSYQELKSKGVEDVYGLSTQGSEYQREAKGRLGLPYELLSDEKLEFARALGLPTFEFGGRRLIKRMTLAVREGRVVRVWYPVFPPDKSAGEVVRWLDEGGEKGG